MNHYTSSYLVLESLLGVCLYKADQWNGAGWYVQVNMHGPDGGEDCYLGPFSTKAEADAAGDHEIKRQTALQMK